MSTRISDLLDVLSDFGIEPGDSDLAELPEVGEIHEGETVYTTSIANVLGGAGDDEGLPGLDQGRLRDWRRRFEEIFGGMTSTPPSRGWERPRESIEPHCAWYCPVHFFGYGWGIYIRETCVLSAALDVAQCVNWGKYTDSFGKAMCEILRSAFYVFFLHEQFHHKVESIGFRFLVATASDRYRPYKKNVYRASYGTSDCLEESLANAESYRRLAEQRYLRRISGPVLEGLRSYLRWIIPSQPPGYAEGINYLTEKKYRDGLALLQSQILDGKVVPTTSKQRWRAAPNMITALADISDEIYVIVPGSTTPIFRPSTIDPGYTASTRDIAGALTKYHGYTHVQGGKGSHIKLKCPGKETIILPGNRAVISPGVVRQVLRVVGDHHISKLPDLLAGRL